jgi:hypothetical protein
MADAELGARSGLTRRQMIRASAVAGAAAWTAPMIVDSLASPAAAGSGPCSTYYAAKWDDVWTAEPFSGNCNIDDKDPFNGHALQNPATYPVFTADAGNGNSSITLPPGCNSFQFVRIHYGNLPSGLGCSASGNVCYEPPLTACSPSPPTATTCGCMTADGNTVYFPAQGLSNIHAIWCC